MPTPYNQDLTIAISTTTSGGAYVAELDLRSIKFPAAFTGATISFTGGVVGGRSGNNAEPATYTAITDSAGAAITVTVSVGKIVTLTEAQRDALRAAHWIKIVSASSEAAARTVTLIGVSAYK